MKFNIAAKNNTGTRNHEGAKAFTLSPEMELYSAVATTMLSDVTYESGDARLSRIQGLVKTADPRFAAKLAVYARTALNLRTAPLVLATELAKRASGTDLVSKTVANVVLRPDEITELLAYYAVANKREGAKKLSRISKQVQKGLAQSFNRFDEYQFAKYNRDGAVKLRDALFLIHPKAKDKTQQAIFDKLVKGELATPYTWETELSGLGQQHFESDAAKAEAVKAKWEELIASRKLGYMALLRNLRNILQAGVSGAHMEMVCTYLSNEKAVQSSKQLPFRFLSAYRELSGEQPQRTGIMRYVAGLIGQNGYTSMVLDALEEAVRLSVANMKGFGVDTKVVIACDVSGSMQIPVSKKSSVKLYDIGLLLGMLLQSKCKNVVSGMFGDMWKTVSLPAKNVLANVDAFYKREGEVGYSTNGYLVLQDLVNRRYVADKVMLFTDVQMWDSNTVNASAQNTIAYQWKLYKKMAPAAKLYLFDLAGHGTTPLKMERDDVVLIAGWSDKVFDVLEAVEAGAGAIQAIDAIEL